MISLRESVEVQVLAPPSGAGRRNQNANSVGILVSFGGFRAFLAGLDPAGPDRDCRDFRTQAEAQAFFIAAGGPTRDPHRLRGTDGDDRVCESLP